MQRAGIGILAMLAAVGCGSGGMPRGQAFAVAALLTPISAAEEAHDELLRADLSRSDSVARLGYAEALGGYFTSDVVYLRGGLPIVRGRAAARAIVAAEAIGASTAVRWQPVRAEVSTDGQSGYSYGYTVYGTAAAPAPTLRVDRYIAFWRRDSLGWRMSAYAETYGAPPPALSLPIGAQSAVVADSPMARGRGPLDAMRQADSDFARYASRYGTGEAFGRYAADNAQMFSAPGEFITGPEAITQSFGHRAARGGTLSWYPVHGEVARSGDLGFTVGNAVFAGTREDGSPTVGYSKYLTVWRRQRDGGWRFLVDGGSARPNQ